MSKSRCPHEVRRAAVAEGMSLKGNFVWSAMDNFEWTDGNGTRFGIVYVDFNTQKRIPKLSAHWFREAAAVAAAGASCHSQYAARVSTRSAARWAGMYTPS